MNLRPYQTAAINQIAKYLSNSDSALLQLATGGGKSIIFAGLTERFKAKFPTRIVIVVHREELLKQAIKTLKAAYGIRAGVCVAGSNFIADGHTYCETGYCMNPKVPSSYCVPHNPQVVVGMVETVNNRLRRDPDYFGEVGLLILDEAHIGNFRKLYSYFKGTKIVGFTATPISASKKFPLNEQFDNIVCGVNIHELIKDGFLCQNITRSPKNIVSRKSLKIKNGEFDERAMGAAFSNPKFVKHTVSAYQQYCEGKKTLIFNCNVEHSKSVDHEFVINGYNSRHLDGSATPEQRRECLDWFKNTPDAILNNCALFTTGFDEPSVESVIVNKATLSLPLWLQMTGRGSRKFGNLTTFDIIDMGGNAAEHGDWNHPHDWYNIFHNPTKWKSGGVAPVKTCINDDCEAIIHASIKICPYCLTNNEKDIVYDNTMPILEVITQGINVKNIIDRNADYKPYRSLHIIKNDLVKRFKKKYHEPLTEPVRQSINTYFQKLVKEWCENSDRPYNKWHKDITQQWLNDELNLTFPNVLPQSNQLQPSFA